jgi:hypothetical protein
MTDTFTDSLATSLRRLVPTANIFITGEFTFGNVPCVVTTNTAKYTLLRQHICRVSVDNKNEEELVEETTYLLEPNIHPYADWLLQVVKYDKQIDQLQGYSPVIKINLFELGEEK